MNYTSAYLLVFHGSRDPRPQIAVERLAYLIRQQLELKSYNFASLLQKSVNKKHDLSLAPAISVLSKPAPLLVATASLECSSIPLHQSIEQFAKHAQASGLSSVKIVPLFLLPGVHVKEDIPSAIALAQIAVGKSIKLELCAYLGSYPGITQLLSQKFSQFSTDGRILLTHGSHRLGGNQIIEAIASLLQAFPAYWSVYPSLAMQVEALAQKNAKSIAIIPYFLFNGAIIDKIDQQVQQLRQIFPKLQLFLAQPLGVTTELARIIVEKGLEIVG